VRWLGKALTRRGVVFWWVNALTGIVTTYLALRAQGVPISWLIAGVTTAIHATRVELVICGFSWVWERLALKSRL
jgi:hypothetical protein